MKRSYKGTSLKSVLGVGKKEPKERQEADGQDGSKGGVGPTKPGLGKGQSVKDGPADEDKSGDAHGVKGEVLEGWVTIHDATAHRPKDSVTKLEPIFGSSSKSG